MPRERYFPGMAERSKPEFSPSFAQSPLEHIKEEGAFFAEIEKMAPDLAPEELTAVVGRILEHDSETGLNFMESLRLPPEQIAEIVSSAKFIYKHPKLANLLLKKIQKNSSDIQNQELAEKYSREFAEVEALRQKNQTQELNQILVKKPFGLASAQAQTLLKKIDRHYLPILAQRQISSKTRFVPAVSQGEHLAEQTLRGQERKMEETLYTGPIKDLIIKIGLREDPEYFEKLADKLCRQFKEYKTRQDALKDIKEHKAPDESQILTDYLKFRRAPDNLRVDLLSANLVPLETVKQLQQILGINEQEWQSCLKKAKYTSALESKALAKKYLQEELISSLEARYPNKEIKILQDEKTEDYIVEIKNLEEGEINEKTKEEYIQKAKKAMDKLFAEKEWYDCSQIAVEMAKVGEKEAAKEAMDKLFAKKQWHFGSRIAVEIGDIQKAKEAMDKLFAKKKWYEGSQIAVKLVKTGEKEAAKEAMDKLFAEKLWYEAGLIAVEIGDIQKAKEAMDKLFAEGGLGYIAIIAVELVKTGEKEAAKETMDKLFAEKQWHFGSLIAVEMAKAGEKEAAKEAMDKLFAEKQWHPGSLIAVKLVKTGEKEAAKEAMDKLFAEEQWHRGSQIAVEIGDFQKAKEAMDKLFAEKQWHQGSQIAVEMAKVGEKEAAKEAMDKLFAEKWWFEAGLIAVEIGDIQKAKEAKDKLFAEGGLGYIPMIAVRLVKTGEKEAAKEAMDKLFAKRLWYDGSRIAVEMVKTGEKEAVKEAMDKLFAEKQWHPGSLIAVEMVKHLNKKNEDESILNPSEQKKLDILNLLQNPELEKIKAYFTEKYDQKSREEESREYISQSARVAAGINASIAAHPEMFLEKLSATADLTAEFTAQRMLFKLFPELLINKKAKGFWSAFGRSGEKFGGQERTKEPNPEDYLNPMEAESLGGGDPNLGDSREVLRMREFYGRFISRNILGRYNREKKQWEKEHFTVPPDIGQPNITRTFTLPFICAGNRVRLPLPVGVKIIPERVFSIDAKDNKTWVQTEMNSLGEATVEAPKNAKTLIYSFTESLVEMPLPELESRADLEIGYRQLNDSSREALTEKIAALPADLKMFIASIKNRPPKEKLSLIEQFVRSISYYDFDNGEMRDLKRGKDMNETLAIMRARITELITQKPEIADKLKIKKYAGVCADFAMLTTLLLREAGFASGVALGFAPQNKSVTVAEAHSVSFALYPGVDGKLRPVELDGTPTGLTDEEEKMLSSMRLDSLEDRQSQAEADLEKFKQELDGRLEEILKIVRGKNKEQIKNLTNGELEQVVNLLLTYEVKKDHFRTALSALNAFWYTPYKDMDLSGEEARKMAGQFVISEIKRMKGLLQEQTKPTNAGRDLFNLLEDYIRKFKKGGKAKTDEEALDMMQTIFDSIESELDPTESKAATAIITYLKAKKSL